MVLLVKYEVVARNLVHESHFPKAFPRGAQRVMVLEAVPRILCATIYLAQVISMKSSTSLGQDHESWSFL